MGKTLLVANVRWEQVGSRELLVATTNYNNSVIDVVKDDVASNSSYPAHVIMDYMASMLYRSSLKGMFTRIVESEDNYVVFERMYYDSYNECDIIERSIVVYDEANTRLFVGTLD